ncbi:alpha-amylase family protein [uncultured Arcticibacterium sp.]|uniref:alpha-amylase family protein n=1 Tax=uncultured Arcticibacterium sp. TaxID=2173042 RepID=UPI0030F518FE
MKFIKLLALLVIPFSILAQKPISASDDSEWWKRNNLRLIQMNLPAYEAANIDADEIVEDLKAFSANTLIINGAGIMSFYQSDLDFEYTNPYMKPGEMGRIVERCHENGIRVIIRFDFSRAHETIFEAHPDWFYISEKGERIINTDKYVVSINAPYVQEKAFKIVEEVISRFDIDGIFLNMPGYQTRNPYENIYVGIDQNEYDKEVFRKWSGGLTLPLKEDRSDPVFNKYLEFKTASIEDWSKRLHKVVKSSAEKRSADGKVECASGKKIAICTYLEESVDIIRHESQTHGLPYWPYTASDNTNHIEQTFPNKIVSNASIQQISFQSRYNAIEPEEISIRLYENIANGSGTDVSMMGDMRDYEDERNFDTMKKIYAHQKKYEPYFGKYESLASVAVLAPGYWPGGDKMQEYRGISLMLKEAHVQFDVIQDNHLANLEDKIKEKYKVLIMPDINYLSDENIAALKEISKAGVKLIATNTSLFDKPVVLKELFGASIDKSENDGAGNYLRPKRKDIFKSFEGQSMVHFKFNLGLYEFDNEVEKLLPILSKGRPGPPEMIGGHEPTGYFGAGIKENSNVLMPINIGKIYYQHGYEQHKNLVLDVLKNIHAEAFDEIITSAHPRVELILQDFMMNKEGVTIHTPFKSNGHILHLVNLTGFSGNTYFEPHTQQNIGLNIKVDFKPSKVWIMQGEEKLAFTYANGNLKLILPSLKDFEGIVIER